MKAKVIHSPYATIPNGTEAEVLQIIKDHFGKGLHMYILDLPCTTFQAYEVEIIQERSVEPLVKSET